MRMKKYSETNLGINSKKEIYRIYYCIILIKQLKQQKQHQDYYKK